MMHRLFRAVALLVMVLALSACGDSDVAAPPVSEASATIGAQGGTLIGPDGVELIVPAGALS